MLAVAQLRPYLLSCCATFLWSQSSDYFIYFMLGTLLVLINSFVSPVQGDEGSIVDQEYPRRCLEIWLNELRIGECCHQCD